MEVPSAATMYAPQSDPHIDALVAAGRARFNEVFLVSRMACATWCAICARRARSITCPTWDFGRQARCCALFGVQAATLLATAQLAKKRDAAVLPVLDFWNPETGKYHAEVLPPLENFPGEDTLEEATARLNCELKPAPLPQPVLLGAPPLQDPSARRAQDLPRPPACPRPREWAIIPP